MLIFEQVTHAWMRSRLREDSMKWYAKAVEIVSQGLPHEDLDQPYGDFDLMRSHSAHAMALMDNFAEVQSSSSLPLQLRRGLLDLMLWKDPKSELIEVEIYIRTTEPYWHHCHGRAPSSTLTVDYTSLPTPSLALRALANGHLGLALIGFNSMLAEVLVVCVASLNDNEASQTLSFRGFWYPFVIIIYICFVMSGSMAFLWSKRRRTWLPRAPGSIASIVVYLNTSKMLNDFKSMHRLFPRERSSKLQARGKTYSLGWFESGLGKRKVRIDEEPRIAKYFPPGNVGALLEETADRNSESVKEYPLNQLTSRDS